MVKTLGWVAVGLGALSIVLAPAVFAIVAAAYTLHQPDVTALPGARCETDVLAAIAVVVACAIPIANFVLYRRSGRSRTALVGLGLTLVGPLLLIGGFVLFAIAAIVGVIGLWLSSLV